MSRPLYYHPCDVHFSRIGLDYIIECIPTHSIGFLECIILVVERYYLTLLIILYRDLPVVILIYITLDDKTLLSRWQTARTI